MSHKSQTERFCELVWDTSLQPRGTRKKRLLQPREQSYSSQNGKRTTRTMTTMTVARSRPLLSQMNMVLCLSTNTTQTGKTSVSTHCYICCLCTGLLNLWNRGTLMLSQGFLVSWWFYISYAYSSPWQILTPEPKCVGDRISKIILLLLSWTGPWLQLHHPALRVTIRLVR